MFQIRKKQLIAILLSKILLICTTIFGLSGCVKATPNDDYREFLVRFQQNCPTYYRFKKIPKQDVPAICDCMEREITENWPTIHSLDQVLHEKDRDPRGEADLVWGSIRITLDACHAN